MAMVAAKLPMICRPLVGGLRKNGVGWNWHCDLHGLPQDGSVSHLRNSVNGAEVYLVGTCHASAKSAQLVKQVIGCVNPNIIAVELCKRRVQSYQQLKPYQPSLLKLLLNSWHFPGTPRMKLLHFCLHFLYHMLRVIGIEPGKEFKIALEECKRLEAQLFLIDEDINVSLRKLVDARLRKLGDSLSITDVEGLKQLAGKIEIEDLNHLSENMTERNLVRQLIENLKCNRPELVRVFVTHRDQVMFENLRKCEGKVVAVVGMAHMDGIEEMWKDIEQNLRRIDGALFDMGWLWLQQTAGLEPKMGLALCCF